jgi:alkanesulfonate monooxygenase SsuD/methylene tetrahydromethanopterin reductase-like flavin-dependent oxidoreductase (luciferase family)
LPTVEEAADYEFSATELAFVQERRIGQALGSPKTVQAQLTELLRRTAADELMITNQVYDLADRLRSYELVAGLDLPAVSANPAA